MRVKHPVLNAVYDLRPSQVDEWLAAGWVAVGVDDAPSVELEPVDGDDLGDDGDVWPVDFDDED